MSQRGFSSISLLIISIILFLGITALLQNNFLSDRQTTFVTEPTSLPTTIPSPNLTPTEKPTTTPIESPIISSKWIWEVLGCGSSVPCSYRVYSTTNPNTYICGGYYDKTSKEGEKQPSPNEDPRITTNFKCTQIE
jgi:hypothetical protein